MINNTQDMFQDKTENVFNFLWNCTNKIYPLIKGESSDDINKDKAKQLKPLFNSAIEEVKKRKETRSRSREKEIEEKRGNNYNSRGRYNTRGRFMRGGLAPYQRGRGRGFIESPQKRGGITNRDKLINTSIEKTNKNEAKEEGLTNNTSTINNNNDDQANKNIKKKIRCKNWPQCTETDCKYSHPTETVSIH